MEAVGRATTAAVLGLVAGIGVTLPSLLSESDQFLTAATAFGGGFLLAVAFVHILPEATCLALDSTFGDFPWAPTALTAGYLALASVETLALRIAESAGTTKLWCRPPARPHECAAARVTVSLVADTDGSTGREQALLPGMEANESQTSIQGLTAPGFTRAVSAIAATAGLTVHSWLEGLALGLRNDWGDFVVIAVTIAVHKLFAAVALGAVLEGSTLRAARRWAAFMFCTATPVGMALGWMLLDLTACTVSAPFSAFSAGSLVWVAVHEVIGPSLHGERACVALCATWLGFALMTLVAVWA